VSYAVLGIWDRAVAHFEKATKLAPENAAARANLKRAREMAAGRATD